MTVCYDKFLPTILLTLSMKYAYAYKEKRPEIARIQEINRFITRLNLCRTITSHTFFCNAIYISPNLDNLLLCQRYSQLDLC